MGEDHGRVAESMKPYYLFTGEDSLPEELCEVIIGIGLRAEAEQAAVYLEGKDTQKQEVRNNTISWINDKTINELLGEYVKHANKLAGWNFHINSYEVPQFSSYGPGQFYDWHVDMGVEKPTDPAYRKLSVSIALNETYMGGDFQVAEWGIPVTDTVVTLKDMRKAGSVCVFPSFIHHRVTPVEVGTRYSLVGWFRGDMFK